MSEEDLKTKLPKDARTTTITGVSAYIATVLPDNPLAGYNSSVHILYMTAFLSIVGFLCNISPIALKQPPRRIWGITFLVSLLCGALVDYFIADKRETILLKQREGEYRNALLGGPEKSTHRKVGEIYKCELCGNVVEVKEGGNGEFVCHGKLMELVK